jgi:hypothetical protein
MFIKVLVKASVRFYGKNFWRSFHGLPAQVRYLGVRSKEDAVSGQTDPEAQINFFAMVEELRIEAS